MLSLGVHYEGGGERQLLDLAYRLFDLRPLAVRVAEIVEQQNAENRTHGLDRWGVPFTDLAPSTMKKRERQARTGPPLAPDGSGSPIVTGFVVDVEVARYDDILVRGHWPGVPWVGFHVDSGRARTHLPVRDPAGLPADAQERIADAFEDFLAQILAQVT